MGLFEEIRKKSDKYISIDFAVECLALREGSLYKAVMVLLHYKVDEEIPCYIQDEYFSFTDIDNDKTSEYSAFEILKDIKKEAESNGGVESKIIDISDSLKSKISKYYWERDLFLSFEPIEKSLEFKVVHLTKDDEFIAGFNDELQGTELEKNTDASNLELQQLKLENEKLKAELAEKDQKIKELESLKPKNDMDLLSLIFDESATKVYAPDLVNAIKLWEYLYVDDKFANDSHSSRANHWIGKNTPYKGESSVEVKRLREVTSPFNSWHNERKNKLNK